MLMPLPQRRADVSRTKMTSRQAVIAEMANRRPLDQTAAIVQVFDEELAASRNEKLYKQVRSWEQTLVLPFFAQMRRLTLVGYYTSQIGQEQELKVEIIPGALHGCVPAEPEVKR